jgi:hypothetical protein
LNAIALLFLSRSGFHGHLARYSQQALDFCAAFQSRTGFPGHLASTPLV